MYANNFCQFIGRLTKDPEFNQVKDGVGVAKFVLAIDTKRKNPSGESVKDVTFIECEVWAEAADYVKKWINKGDEVLVQAHHKTDRWTDKEGTDRTRSKYRVDTFKLLRKKGAGLDSNNSGNSGNSSNSSNSKNVDSESMSIPI